MLPFGPCEKGETNADEAHADRSDGLNQPASIPTQTYDTVGDPLYHTTPWPHANKAYNNADVARTDTSEAASSEPVTPVTVH